MDIKSSKLLFIIHSIIHSTFVLRSYLWFNEDTGCATKMVGIAGESFAIR